MSLRFLIVLSAIFFAFSGGIASAGTTGALSGTVNDTDGHPVAGARVAVASPSQNEASVTDAHGTFFFASLAPDAYVVTVAKQGYEPLVLRDERTTADQTRNVVAVLRPVLRTIGRAATTANGLVRPGVTRDVYTISPAVAQAAEALGGGADLQNAYSAISAVPGVTLPFGQVGAEQSIYIRGGDAYQVGYEYDGVPLNRAFDQASTSTASNLGQAELQVYTNGGDDGASASGIAGFINQVIRTGTYPGFAQAKIGLGSTAFYHSISVEAGGATPNHLFSYYAGLSGYNQDYRYIDQFNGAGQEIFQNALPTSETSGLINASGIVGDPPRCVGAAGIADPFGGAPPAPGVQNAVGCFSTVSPVFSQVSDIADREAVVNLHLGIPHRHDVGHDDVQLLFSSSSQLESYYSSPDDAGQALVSGLDGGPAQYPDSITWPSGTKFGQPATGLTAVPYYDPSSIPHAVGAPLPVTHRDTQTFEDGLLKVQYQKNIGASAYVRLYVYSFYSARAINGAAAYSSGGVLPGALYDYELDTHSRGATLKTAFALGSKNAIDFTLNAATATSYRYNNDDYDNYPGTRATNLTDGSHCFAYEAGIVSGISYAPGDAAPCNSPLTSGTFGDPTRAGAPAVGAAAAAGATWRVTYAGQRGFVNNVTPIFTSASISDHFRPSARLTIEGALRYDRFDNRLPDTSGNGRSFWFKAAQNEFCYNPVNGQAVFGAIVPLPLGFIESGDPFVGTNCPVDSTSGKPVQTVHPDGRNGHLLFSNVYDHDEAASVLQPRIGFTYAAGRDTVFRFSYGMYAQGPISAPIQYDAKQSNLAAPLFLSFWGLGYTTPRHESRPLVSNDIDFSYEHRFNGSDTALKITPYYRTASNQYYFGYVSGTLATAINSGFQQSYGFEAEATKGDFKRQGLSGLVSYAYLDSRERYGDYPGTKINPIDQYNQDITTYNALTKAGGAAPCYANSGDSTPDNSCGATSIRNPYYANAPQPLVANGAQNPPGLDAPYLSQHAFTAIANYRRGRFSVTPSLQITSGPKYGTPADVRGIDPRTCTNNSAAIVNSPIAKTNPLQADYTSCGLSVASGGALYIPNPDTGKFDSFGQFTQPWHLGFNAALGYDVAKKAHLSLTLANVYQDCFGGSRTPASTLFPPNSSTCSYQSNFFYVSNFYNGTSPNDLGANGVPLNSHFATVFKPQASDPNLGNFVTPFNAYLQLSIDL